MTIGERLKSVENQKSRERFERRSNLLRQFVKTDLLKALTRDIDEGGSGHRAVEAPKEISFLFAASLSYDVDDSPYGNKNSVYYPVWRELDDWATSENLRIRTGESFDHERYSGVPWSDRRWGGYLYVSMPKPVEAAVEKKKPIERSTGIGSYVAMAVIGVLVVVVCAFIVASLMHTANLLHGS